VQVKLEFRALPPCTGGGNESSFSFAV